AMTRRTRVGVVVVVPAFAEAEQTHPPEVAGVIGSLVIAVAPGVRGRVHQPGDVVDINEPDEAAPYDAGQTAPEAAATRVSPQEQQTGHDELPDRRRALDENVALVAGEIQRILAELLVIVELRIVREAPEHVRPEEAMLG